jgi:HEAT repeat protein
VRERALDVLEQAARDDNPQIRANAIEALSSAPTRAEAAVSAGLRDPNEGVRSVAAMVAGRAKLTRLAPTLRTLLSDKSPYVRASAIYALNKVGDPVNPTPLGLILFSDPSPRVRSHAVFVVGELGEKSALPMIRTAASTPIPRASQVENRLFQLQAAEAMVKLGDDTRLEPIIAALFPASPEDLEATALAAQILGQLGHKPVVNDLNNLAGGTYMGGKMPAEVRLAAAASLAKLGRPQNVALVADEFRANEAQVLRAQAVSVYGELKDQSQLAKLDPMLKDGSGLVRVSAAAAILKIAGG